MPVPARLVAIPTTDAQFAAEAQRVAARIPEGLDPDQAIHWYRLALRRSSPAAVVRQQEPMATIGATQTVWYVSRHDPNFRIDSSIWVPVPRNDAWRVYVERMTEWLRVVDLTPRVPEGPVVGREYDLGYGFFGSRWHGTMRILTAEPGRSVSVEAEGSPGFSVWWVTTFHEERDGTMVRVKGDYELPHGLLGRVADRVWIEGVIGSDIERANAAFRAMCVSSGKTATPAAGSIWA